MLGGAELKELLVKPKETVSAQHSAEPDLWSPDNKINWSFAKMRTVEFGAVSQCQCRIIYCKYRTLNFKGKKLIHFKLSDLFIMK